MSKICQILYFFFLSLFITSILAKEKTAISTIKLNGNASSVIGTIFFREIADGVIQITGQISNLSVGNHGFHIHTSGNLSNGCLATGSHFNPLDVSHGAPNDAVRHVGDLGNILADAEGVARVNFVDNLIRLDAVGVGNSIIGRGVVVHSGEDDLGRGGFDDSKTTGHAGSRVGCGIIELSPNNNVATLHSFSIVFYVTLYACLFNYL